MRQFMLLLFFCIMFQQYVSVCDCFNNWLGIQNCSRFVFTASVQHALSGCCLQVNLIMWPNPAIVQISQHFLTKTNHFNPFSVPLLPLYPLSPLSTLRGGTVTYNKGSEALLGAPYTEDFQRTEHVQFLQPSVQDCSSLQVTPFTLHVRSQKQLSRLFILSSASDSCNRTQTHTINRKDTWLDRSPRHIIAPLLNMYACSCIRYKS